MDLNTIEKLYNIDQDFEIDHLIIKFYKTKNNLIKNDSEYSFFFDSIHEIEFEFIYSQEEDIKFNFKQ